MLQKSANVKIPLGKPGRQAWGLPLVDLAALTKQERTRQLAKKKIEEHAKNMFKLPKVANLSTLARIPRIANVIARQARRAISHHPINRSINTVAATDFPAELRGAASVLRDPTKVTQLAKNLFDSTEAGFGLSSPPKAVGQTPGIQQTLQNNKQVVMVTPAHYNRHVDPEHTRKALSQSGLTPMPVDQLEQTLSDGGLIERPVINPFGDRILHEYDGRGLRTPNSQLLGGYTQGKVIRGVDKLVEARLLAKSGLGISSQNLASFLAQQQKVLKSAIPNSVTAKEVLPYVRSVFGEQGYHLKPSASDEVHKITPLQGRGHFAAGLPPKPGKKLNPHKYMLQPEADLQAYEDASSRRVFRAFANHKQLPAPVDQYPAGRPIELPSKREMRIHTVTDPTGQSHVIPGASLETPYLTAYTTGPGALPELRESLGGLRRFPRPWQTAGEQAAVTASGFGLGKKMIGTLNSYDVVPKAGVIPNTIAERWARKYTPNDFVVMESNPIDREGVGGFLNHPIVMANTANFARGRHPYQVNLNRDAVGKLTAATGGTAALGLAAPRLFTNNENKAIASNPVRPTPLRAIR